MIMGSGFELYGPENGLPKKMIESEEWSLENYNLLNLVQVAFLLFN